MGQATLVAAQSRAILKPEVIFHSPACGVRIRFCALTLAACFCLLDFADGAAAQTVRVEGVVRDAAGAVVAGAEISLTTSSSSASRTTDARGNFAFDAVPQTSGSISVRARGFAPLQRAWRARPGDSARLEIVLLVSPINEQLVVTATRMEMRLGDIADSALALTADDLSATPALLLDDKLRQIPGFSLFRRSGSRTANPTSQGVSLSGLGASGASRALVLNDGVPLNDPFGGWIYWSRIPQQALSGVEVVRRGASSLYGGDALGGVIQLLDRRADRPAFSLDTSYGNQQTPNLSFWAAERAGSWEAALAGEFFRTDGYILVPSSVRGTVDTAANSEFATVDLTLGRRFGNRGRAFGRGSFFTEARHNGTPLQTNDTRMAQGMLGVDTKLGDSGTFSLRMYGTAQRFNQNFSAVVQNRMTESLTDMQHVPAQQVGATAWWSHPAGRFQTWGAGLDLRNITGASEDKIFSSGKQTAIQLAGGRQTTSGIFGEDVLRIGARWIVTASLRFDGWRNYHAQFSRRPLSMPGPPTITLFPNRTENALSPRLSLLYAVRKSVSVTASGYRSFRSPTLNELYRSFRVGNILTQANSGLHAERLTGAEAGVRVSAVRDKLDLRGNFFWNDIVNPVTNVTLTVTPTLITRQRQNLGRTRSRGVDFDAVARLTDTMEVSGGYQFVDATVIRFPANTLLQGLQVPQVPRHQLTAQVRYAKPSSFLFSLQGRFVGAQFEDDQNQLRLERFFTLDLLAGRSLGRGLEAYAGFESLLNRRYTVGLTPVRTLGPPLLARVGLRFHYAAR